MSKPAITSMIVFGDSGLELDVSDAWNMIRVMLSRS
jgi:hypothetical protein